MGLEDEGLVLFFALPLIALRVPWESLGAGDMSVI